MTMKLAGHALLRNSPTAKGQQITLIDKGIVHSQSNGRDWIDNNRVGRAFFMTVSRVGTKYVHGNITYWDADKGFIQNGDWETAYAISEFDIFEGFRADLGEKFNAYRARLEAYEKAYENKRRDIENIVRDEVGKQFDGWLKAHPRPTYEISS